MADDGKPLVSAAFSLDGGMLAVLDGDKNTVVYNSASGHRVTAIRGELRWLSPAPSSGPMALALRDSSMQLVDLRSFGPAYVVKEIAPRGYLRGRPEQAVSPDGHRFAVVADAAGKARLSITDRARLSVTDAGEFFRSR
jgi:hypothetical protein